MLNTLSRCLYLGAYFIAVIALQAQDKIISLRGTEERITEGEIVGTTSNGSPRIRTAGGVETVVQIAEVRNIIKDEPTGLVAARESFQKNEYDKAIELARPVAEQFSGLPISWAVEAFGIVADSYLEKGDSENASAWYKKISEAYAQTQFKTKGEIGQARIALLEGNKTAAEQTIRELVETAKSTLRPNRVESQVFADAFFLLARIQEQRGDYSEALASYLRIPALYPENPTLVNRSLESAARLKSEHKVIVN